MSDLRQRRFGQSGRPLSELSDEELEQELRARRRARAQGQGRPEQTTGPGPGETGEAQDARLPQYRRIRQYYANLELRPGASLEEVRRAYRDLMRRYHPDKHAGDAERHRAATELAQSLTQAYRALVEHLERGR